MSNPLLNVTTYRKQWIEGYQRQSAQLDRYHQQLTLRDQQEEKAKTAVTPVKMLAQLADAVNKTKQLTDKIDTYQGKKVFQKLDSLGATGESFDILQMLEKHDGKVDEQHADYKEYVKLISGLPAGTKDYLKSLHGRNLYWGKAYLTKQKALELPIQYSELLNYKGDDANIIADRDALTLDLRNAQGNQSKERAIIKHWASKQFGDEFISDEILSKYAGEHIGSFLEAEGVLSAQKTVQLTAGKNNEEFVNNFKVASTSKHDLQEFTVKNLDIIEADITNAPKTYTASGVIIEGEYIDGITEESSNRTIARKIFAKKLIGLSNKDQFLRADLNNLTERGSIKNAPQGDSIENFFTEDELTPVYAAADRATLRASLVATAEKEKQNERLLAKGLAQYQGENWNKEGLQSLYNQLELNGATEKQLKTIERRMENNDSEASYIEEKTTYLPHESQGYLSLDDDVIEDIPNWQYRTEVQNAKAKYQDKSEAAKVPQLTEGYISKWLGGEGVTTFEKLTLHGEAKAIKHDLQKKANELTVAGIDKFNYSGEDLANYVSTELDKYWVSNGGGLTSDSPSVRDGTMKGAKFVVNQKTNTYDNYKKWRTDDFKKAHKVRENMLQASQPLDQKQVNNITNNIKGQFFEQGGYNVPNARENIINKPGAVIQPSELQTMLLNEGYSQKFLVQCKALKMPPAVVFEHQVKSIIDAAANGDTDAAKVVEFLGLDKVQIPDTEAEFWKGIEDNKDHPDIAEISNLLTTKGWENLSPKQKARVGFTFLNNDFSNTEIFENGVPLKIGGYDKRAHEIRTDQLKPDETGANVFEKGTIEEEDSEWGPDGQPSASEVLKQQEKNKKKALKEEERNKILEANLNITTM